MISHEQDTLICKSILANNVTRRDPMDPILDTESLNAKSTGQVERLRVCDNNGSQNNEISCSFPLCCQRSGGRVCYL